MFLPAPQGVVAAVVLLLVSMVAANLYVAREGYRQREAGQSMAVGGPGGGEGVRRLSDGEYVAAARCAAWEPAVDPSVSTGGRIAEIFKTAGENRSGIAHQRARQAERDAGAMVSRAGHAGPAARDALTARFTRQCSRF